MSLIINLSPACSVCRPTCLNESACGIPHVVDDHQPVPRGQLKEPSYISTEAYMTVTAIFCRPYLMGLRSSPQQTEK